MYKVTNNFRVARLEYDYTYTKKRDPSMWSKLEDPSSFLPAAPEQLHVSTVTFGIKEHEANGY